MLKLTNVDSYYDRSHILHAVCLDIPIGKITAVLGRNGTGKTTLLKTLMGLTDRMEGQINLNGTEIGREPTFRRARAGIAYVPQGREIIPDFSIRENILMGAFARTDGKRQIPELVPELFPYLMDNLERPGGVLSGGQQQQLAIARALAADPQDHPAGRAERRHPAVHRRGNRSHHHQAQPGGRPDGRPGRAERHVCAPGVPLLRHDGEGADRGVRRNFRTQR